MPYPPFWRPNPTRGPLRTICVIFDLHTLSFSCNLLCLTLENAMTDTLRLGYETAADGEMVGVDPRTLTRDQLRAIGHEPMPPMRAIRAKCIDCCAGSVAEVRVCTALSCPSWPYRMGSNPWRKPMSDAQRAAARQMGLARRGSVEKT